MPLFYLLFIHSVSQIIKLNHAYSEMDKECNFRSTHVDYTEYINTELKMIKSEN